ncbi:ABC transporter permease [Lysinibacillus sp. LZ02]|uniref:ABC transporter permease n=1 Tax=Lysinibacillus sp. LZ02 TaxID=3420668 RepID=UPI003D362013
MSAIFNLINRHNKVYRRDKLLVLFSFLSVLIVITLYAVFLQKLQVDAIEEIVPASSEITTLVNEWMIAGLLSIVTVTTTLAAFGIYIRDLETKGLADFLTAPTSRAALQLSYVANTWMIGFILSVIAFILCELFIVATGGHIVDAVTFIEIIGIIALSVSLSSMFNLFFTLLVSTQTAFSTLNTIIGTAIGFLCGVYVPMGSLPNAVQNVIMLFPISHSTVLFREKLMVDSLDNVFSGTPEALAQYKKNFGVVYEWNNTLLSTSVSYIVIIGSTIALATISLLIFKLKNK